MEENVRTPTGEQKLTQAAAAFRRAEGEDACAKCVNFMPPDKCQLVMGTIGPAGVCDLFEPQNTGQVGAPGVADILFGMAS